MLFEQSEYGVFVNGLCEESMLVDGEVSDVKSYVIDDVVVITWCRYYKRVGNVII